MYIIDDDESDPSQGDAKSEEKNIDSDLPPFWSAAYDPQTKQEYYVNSKTKETTWDKPRPAVLSPRVSPVKKRIAVTKKIAKKGKKGKAQKKSKSKPDAVHMEVEEKETVDVEVGQEQKGKQQEEAVQKATEEVENEVSPSKRKAAAMEKENRQQKPIKTKKKTKGNDILSDLYSERKLFTFSPISFRCFLSALLVVLFSCCVVVGAKYFACFFYISYC